MNLTNRELKVISDAIKFAREMHTEIEEYEHDFDEDELIELHVKIKIELDEF